VREIRRSPDDPPFIATVGIIVGIVALVIGCSLLWGFALGRVHEARVTDQGVTWDGKHWPWASVRQIRTTPDLPATGLPDGPAYMEVTVKRPWFRSRLTLRARETISWANMGKQGRAAVLAFPLLQPLESCDFPNPY